MKHEPREIIFDDGQGSSLRAILRPDGGHWETCLVHRIRDRAAVQGATRWFQDYATAEKDLKAKARAAQAQGWRLRISSSSERVEPARMIVDRETGERIFRDPRTGLVIQDESCTRAPRSVANRAPEPPKNPPQHRTEPEDNFTLASLPEPKRPRK